MRGILNCGGRSRVARNIGPCESTDPPLGMMRRDEYDSLRPIADLIRYLQTHVSRFLAEPLNWKPTNPPETVKPKKSRQSTTFEPKFSLGSTICPDVG